MVHRLLQEAAATHAQQTDLKSVIVAAGEEYTLNARNAFFSKLVLKEDSLFTINNWPNPTIPTRLVINELHLDINGPSALMRLFVPNLSALRGKPVPQAKPGTNGRRTRRGIISPRQGHSGLPGNHGGTLRFRGILYLQINKVVTPGGAPVSKAMVTFDARGVRGGKGGQGGLGGRGGHGAPGVTGRHDCDGPLGCRCSRAIQSGTPGARGGRGGDPGNGGNGGTGATIHFIGDESFVPIIDVRGGRHGNPGIGGKGGRGGTGAARVGGGGDHCGDPHPKEPNGAYGAHRHTEIGAYGKDGNSGGVLIRDTMPDFPDIISEQEAHGDRA